jgi:hypothetical protein
MAKVRVTIEFQNDGGDISRHEKEITAPPRSSKEATERQAQQTFADLQKDLILGTFFDALPDPDGLYKAGKQRFPMEEVFSSSYFDQVNAQSVWLEIQNTLINVRFLLATALGYKELEPPHEDDFSKNGLLYNIHFDKMAQFDLAVFKLTKAEDLLLRLVFEATGAAFVSTDATNWDRQLIWDRVRRSWGAADQSDPGARLTGELPPEDWRESRRERYRNLSLAERDAQDRRIAAATATRWRKKGLP